MKGYKIPVSEDKTRFVEQGFEYLNFEMNYDDRNSVSKICENESRFIVSDTFVIGVYDTDIKNVLEVPLVIGKINKSDWIQAANQN